MMNRICVICDSDMLMLKIFAVDDINVVICCIFNVVCLVNYGNAS